MSEEKITKTTVKNKAKAKVAVEKTITPVETEVVLAENPALKAEAKIAKQKEVKEKIVEATLSLEKGRYVFAVGRRKTSIATVRIFSGKEVSKIGTKTFEEYFFNFPLFTSKVKLPLELLGLGNSVYFTAHLNGGGIKSQSEALAHAIAKAIVSHDEAHKIVLKKNGLLKRDDRIKERKKPGLKRARRRPQWAKR